MKSIEERLPGLETEVGHPELGQMALESKERGFQEGEVVHSLRWYKIIKEDETGNRTWT